MEAILTSEVGWMEEFDMWSWTENPFRIWTLGRGRAVAQDRYQAHSRRNSRECVGILIPLVIVFVVSASSPQSRHRYSQQKQQQPAYLWALQAPDVAVVAVVVALFFSCFFPLFLGREKEEEEEEEEEEEDKEFGSGTDWVAQNVNGGP